MSDRPGITPQLRESRFVAILRGSSADRLQPVAEALLEAGVTCLELTFTTPAMTDVLERLTARLDTHVAVGAGTVMTVDQALAAIDAGASFLATPAVQEPVVRCAVDTGVACYPGAWTATEVARAWELGAAAVKLFPASSGGVAHLRHLRGPFPAIPFLPTGGIDLEQAGSYLAAGAVAVGVGGPLIGDALDEGGDLVALRGRAERLRDRLGGSPA